MRVAGTGPRAHDLGIDAGDAPAHDASHRLQAALLRLVERHDHDGRAAVDDTAGVAGGDGAVLAEGGFSFARTFHRRLGTAMVVFGEHLARGLAFAIAQRTGVISSCRRPAL